MTTAATSFTAATSSTAAATRFALIAALLVCAPAPAARAAELFYTGGNWHTGTTTGPTVAGPTPTDAAHVIDGGIAIPAGLTVTTANSGNTIIACQTSSATDGAAGSIGALAGSSGTATIAGYWNNGSHLVVGGAGTGILNINSGTVNVTGRTYIGRATGGSGTISINGGLMQTTSWVHVGGVATGDSIDLGNAAANGNVGNGYLYIAQGGTLSISGTDGMRVAYGNVNTSGTVVVDGVLKTATGYIQIAHWGKGALTVTQTGTVASGSYISIGGGDGSTSAFASAFIDGRVTAATTFYVATNRAQAVATIGEHGWVTATTEAGVGGATGTTAGTAANGTLYVEAGGRLQVGSNMHVGRNGGQGVLDISGTVTTGNMRIAYSTATVAVATSTLTSGTVFVRNGSYLQTAYMQVGQWGKGYISIEEGGTVRNTDYVIVGQGDDSRARLAAEGYAYVAGQWSSANAFTVGGYSTKALLDIAQTGRVTGGGNFTIGNQANSSGTVNVAGLLQAQAALINANNGRGTLNILSTGTVNVNTTYTQKAAGTLNVELKAARTTPYLTIGEGATLSGTLGIDVTDMTGAVGHLDKASEIPTDSLLLLRASGSITGNFTAVNFTGVGSMPSYVTITGFIENDTDYRVGYALAGAFNLAQGQTFEMDLPLTDRPASSTWDGKSLLKTGAGTLIISTTAARHTGVTLIEDGILQITSPAALTVLRGDLINNSVIDLTAPTTAGHRILRTPRLFGSGTFLMAVNTATHAADRLEVTGDPALLVPATIAGSHQLLLTDTRADGATATDADIAALTLIRIPAAGAINNATFIADPDWDDGSVVYPVRFGPDGAGSLGAPAPSTTSEAALAIAAAQNLMWAGQQDNLARRLGDLRAQPTSTGLWARAYATSATLDPADIGDVRLDLYGLTVGADFSRKALNGNLHAGLYAGYGRATQDFTSTADGESTLIAGGLYAAWLHDAGWFANATLGYARLQNEFTATDAAGLTTADHNDTALALSLESGRRLASTRGWFVEPSAQLSLTRLDQSDYTTAGAHALPVSATAATIYRARAGALFGRTLTFTNDSTLQLHARLGGLYESSTGGETTIGALTRRPNLDGPRAEAGLGLLWRQSAATQFYFDYDAALGQNYEQPWALTLGFRHTF
jgi:outer membrane autotransporter protein